MVKKGPTADRFQQDDDFHVALLHLAVKEDDILAIKDLIRVPNWINTGDRSGRNALHWAVAFGSKDACELLLSRTSAEGVCHVDKIGRTPLHFAAIWGRSDLAKMILARGAEVNAPDRKGMTPLHFAAQNSNPFLIRSLIKRGADKQARDSRKRIPYQIAMNWGSPDEILDLLDPEFNPEKVHKPPEMPQARRFAASLSTGGYQETNLPPSGPPSNKDFPAELVKYEMQRQSDRMRNMLRKAVVKRMRKWEPPGARSREFALKALAARRKKSFVEEQMKKTQQMKRVQDMRNQQKQGRRSGKSSGKSSPSVATSSPKVMARAGKTNTEASSSSNYGTTTSRSESKTPTGTKSSQSSSPTAFKPPAARGKTPSPTFYSRPNTPIAYVRPSTPKPIPPNLNARSGWNSPPGSIRAGAGRPATSPSWKGHKKDNGKGLKEQGSEPGPKPKRPLTRTPSPARLALSEFVGTSARHNALGKYPSPAVHKCVNVQKLQNQWL